MGRVAAWIAMTAVCAALSGCGHWYPGYGFSRRIEANELLPNEAPPASRDLPSHIDGELSVDDDWSQLFPQ